MAGIPWTEEEKGALKKLAEAGCLMPDILKVFPYRSENSISKMASHLKLNLCGKRPEIDFKAFERLMKLGGKQKCL